MKNLTRIVDGVDVIAIYLKERGNIKTSIKRFFYHCKHFYLNGFKIFL
jgi:hypothetical protein